MLPRVQLYRAQQLHSADLLRISDLKQRTKDLMFWLAGWVSRDSSIVISGEVMDSPGSLYHINNLSSSISHSI